MKNRKIDKKQTKQLVVSTYLHTWAKRQAATEEVSLKVFTEGLLIDKKAEVDGIFPKRPKK